MDKNFLVDEISLELNQMVGSTAYCFYLFNALVAGCKLVAPFCLLRNFIEAEEFFVSPGGGFSLNTTKSFSPSFFCALLLLVLDEKLLILCFGDKILVVLCWRILDRCGQLCMCCMGSRYSLARLLITCNKKVCIILTVFSSLH